MTLTEHSTASASGATGAVTVASLARDWAQRAPSQIAMREKDFGIWHEYTWEPTWSSDRGCRLRAAGARRPARRPRVDPVRGPTRVGDPRPRHGRRARHHGRLLPDQSGGRGRVPARRLRGRASTSPRTRSSSTRSMSIDRSRLRDLRTILFVEPRGMLGADDDRLLFWDKFLELGRDYRRQHPNAVADRMASARDDDVMTLVYTSGTTGPPKGAMLTNRNCAFCVDKIVNSHDRVPGGPPTARRPDPHLPPAVPRRRADLLDLDGGRAAGAVLNFAESIETVNENLREVQPTLFFAVPRIWEKLHAVSLIKANDASWFKKRDAAVRARPGEPDRADQGRQRRRAHDVVAGAGRDRLAARVPADARTARAAPLPLRRLRARRRSRRRCSSSSSGSASRSSSCTA